MCLCYVPSYIENHTIIIYCIHNYCRARYYKGPPDISSYFDDHVWTGYMRDLKMACSAHKDGSASKWQSQQHTPTLF